MKKTRGNATTPPKASAWLQGTETAKVSAALEREPLPTALSKSTEGEACPVGRIALEGLRNTRDLGYLGTQDGSRIAPRTLIRSGALAHASRADLNTLTEDYHVHTVIDLRTLEEREKSPEPEDCMPTTRFIHTPILGFSATGITRENGLEGMIVKLGSIPDAPRQLMCGLYPRMLLDETGIEGYARFFDLLTEKHDGAVLWHCSAGKDRAGLASVLLLHALGVSPNFILADYLATNRFLAGRTDELVQMISPELLTPEVLQNLAIINSADEAFLNAGIAGVEEAYGSLDAYLKEALGVDEQIKEHLRSLYLI